MLQEILVLVLQLCRGLQGLPFAVCSPSINASLPPLVVLAQNTREAESQAVDAKRSCELLEVRALSLSPTTENQQPQAWFRLLSQGRSV